MGILSKIKKVLIPERDSKPVADPSFNHITDFNHPLADGFAPEWASGWGQDEYGVFVEITVGDVNQCMRWIPPGQFLMGSLESEHGNLAKEEYEKEWFAREAPRHEVSISKGFWLFDTAVTQALWLAVMGENPSHFSGDDQRPVEQVSWEDCQQFVLKINGLIPGLNLNLPSEAQWEYACRALTETPFHFGDQITTDQANYDGIHPMPGGSKGEYRERTLPVQSFEPNSWGLWQMHGNVWEWCQDGLRDYDEKTQVDPLGPQTDGVSRALRGGCWNDSARYVRSADRSAASPGVRYLDFGFRCARVQDAER